jgi:hypothetical protein
MAALGAAIHVFLTQALDRALKAWVAGPSPARTQKQWRL